jgi:hypothetical protein
MNICFFSHFNSQILTIIKRRNLNAPTPNPVSLADNHFITKDPLLVPQESRNVDVHPEGSVMDIHRDLGTVYCLIFEIQISSRFVNEMWVPILCKKKTQRSAHSVI